MAGKERDIRDKRRGRKNLLLGMLPPGEPQCIHWQSQWASKAHRIQILSLGYQVYFPQMLHSPENHIAWIRQLLSLSPTDLLSSWFYFQGEETSGYPAELFIGMSQIVFCAASCLPKDSYKTKNVRVSAIPGFQGQVENKEMLMQCHQELVRSSKLFGLE